MITVVILNCLLVLRQVPFTGFVFMLLGLILELKTPYPELGGAVLVCSVPPSGNR